MKSKILVAYCTFPDKAVAESICRELVEEGLIACANIFQPHTAVYSWQGEIKSEPETAAILKLNARKQKALEEKVRAKHPYAIPGLIYFETAGGLPEFVQWVYGQSL